LLIFELRSANQKAWENNYRAVKMGMTEKEVAALLGPGQETSRVELGEREALFHIFTKAIEYRKGDRIAIVVFSGDKATMKALRKAKKDDGD
jgi:hypothetical protein